MSTRAWATRACRVYSGRPVPLPLSGPDREDCKLRHLQGHVKGRGKGAKRADPNIRAPDFLRGAAAGADTDAERALKKKAKRQKKELTAELHADALTGMDLLNELLAADGYDDINEEDMYAFQDWLESEGHQLRAGDEVKLA